MLRDVGEETGYEADMSSGVTPAAPTYGRISKRKPNKEVITFDISNSVQQK